MTPIPRPTTDETGMIVGVREMMDSVTRILGVVMAVVTTLFVIITAADYPQTSTTLPIRATGTLIMLGCMMLWFRARRHYQLVIAGAAGIAFSTTLSVCIALLSVHTGTSFEIAMSYGALIAVLNVLLWRSIAAILFGYFGAIGPGFVLMLSQHPPRQSVIDFSGPALATLALTVMALFIIRTLLRELDLMQRQLIAEASVDGLTGLANRRAWLIQVAAWETLNPDAPYEILFFDLDRFKEVNDEFGHEVGDRVLIAFAHALRDLVPLGSTVARFGGDEFVAFIPGTRTDVPSFQIALRGAITRTEARAMNVNVSIGRAAATASSDSSGKDVLWQADRALLETKRRLRRSATPVTS